MDLLRLSEKQRQVLLLRTGSLGSMSSVVVGLFSNFVQHQNGERV